MEIIKELKSTYLTKPHFSYGLLGSLSFLALCVVFSTFYWHHPLGTKLLAKGESVFIYGELYRLFTTQFIHGDLNHLLSNSVMLFILSYYVINFYGIKLFYSYTLLYGALINGITLMNMELQTGLLGASGVVYFLWGFWLSLYFFIDKRVNLNRRMMKIVAISLMMLIPSSFDPQVSYMAHFVGLMVGIFAGVIHFLMNKENIRSFESYKIIVEPSPYWDNEEENYYWL